MDGGGGGGGRTYPMLVAFSLVFALRGKIWIENLKEPKSMVIMVMHTLSFVTSVIGINFTTLVDRAGRKVNGAGFGGWMRDVAQVLILMLQQYGVEAFLQWAVNGALALEEDSCDPDAWFLKWVQGWKIQTCDAYDPNPYPLDDFDPCHIFFNLVPFYIFMIVMFIVYWFVCCVDGGGPNQPGPIVEPNRPPPPPPPGPDPIPPPPPPPKTKCQTVEKICPSCQANSTTTLDNPVPVNGCPNCSKNPKNKKTLYFGCGDPPSTSSTSPPDPPTHCEWCEAEDEDHVKLASDIEKTFFKVMEKLTQRMCLDCHGRFAAGGLAPCPTCGRMNCGHAGAHTPGPSGGGRQNGAGGDCDVDKIIKEALEEVDRDGGSS